MKSETASRAQFCPDMASEIAGLLFEQHFGLNCGLFCICAALCVLLRLVYGRNERSSDHDASHAHTLRHPQRPYNNVLHKRVQNAMKADGHIRRCASVDNLMQLERKTAGFGVSHQIARPMRSMHLLHLCISLLRSQEHSRISRSRSQILFEPGWTKCMPNRCSRSSSEPQP